MPNYCDMYFCLFNALTDVLDALEANDLPAAIAIIREAQCETEELYMADK